MDITTITPQDISNAIRKNGVPQAFHNYFDDGAACAIGQAAINLSDGPTASFADEICAKLDRSFGRAICPGYGEHVTCYSTADDLPAMQDVGLMVIHLNDDHKWTFEQIADWLDGMINEGATK